MPTIYVFPGNPPAAFDCGTESQGATVWNLSSLAAGTVYYGRSTSVTDTSYDGTIAAGATVTLYGTQYFYVPYSYVNGEGVKVRLPRAPLLITLLPVVVGSGGAGALDASTLGVLPGLGDVSAALNSADAAAAAAGKTLFIPPGTYTYSATLTMSTPWVGIPRKTILSKSGTFAFSGYASQFSVMNKNFSVAYNAATADHVGLYGIDLVGAAVTGSKTVVGLANVRSGIIENCEMSTTGTSGIDSLIDCYACVKNVTVRGCRLVNSTGYTSGGCMWVRNLTSAGAAAANVTENITVEDCYFGQTTADEALAVYGVFGKTRRVRVRGCILEGLASSRNHTTLASTFPLSSSGASTSAAVEDVLWQGCTFVDTNGTITGDLVRAGQTGDEANICQDVRFLDCTAIARTAVTSSVQSIFRNVPNAFTGLHSGNRISGCKINTAGSPQTWLYGVNGFETAGGPMSLTGAQVNIAAASCRLVNGGRWEAFGRGFYQCDTVDGAHLKINDSAAGSAFYADGDSGAGFYSWRNCTIVGGLRLATVTGSVPSSHRIDIKGHTMNTEASSGSVVSVPASGAPRVRLLNNTVFGTTALTRTGAIIESRGNDWYGVGEGERVRTYRTTAQAIPTATQTAMSFDAERYDVGGMHEPVTNPSRVTCITAGLHNMTATLEFASNGSGWRQLGLRLNGSTFLARQSFIASSTTIIAARLNVSTDYELVPGDYVEVVVFQDTGGNLDVTAATAEFTAVRLS